MCITNHLKSRQRDKKTNINKLSMHKIDILSVVFQLNCIFELHVFCVFLFTRSLVKVAIRPVGK